MNKDNLTHYYFHDLPSDPRRPKTLEEMGEYLNEKKFFGYLTKEFIQSLEEFCRGLIPYGSNPRLFYEYEGMEQICCIEFIPGTGIVNVATYDYHPVMSALPRYPKYPSELYTEWSNMHNSVENYCVKSCIDNHLWDMERLEHFELSEEEKLSLFTKLVS